MENSKLQTKCSFLGLSERLLALWVDDKTNRDRLNSPMSNAAIQAKALSLYKDLFVKDNESGGPNAKFPHPPFNASKGWLDRFKYCFNFHSINQSGEAACADIAAAQAYLPVLQNIIAEGGYSAQQICNVDETSHGEELNNEDLMAIEQQAAEGEEAEDDNTTTQLDLTRNILADAFRDFDNDIQKIVDNDPNRERSLKLERAIQTAIAAYKQLYQEKVSQAKQSRMT